MNKSNKGKVEIKLAQSINTDSVEQNIFSYEDIEAPHIQNTGIERDGGLTNIYEKENILPTGSNTITDNNQVLNFNNGAVSIDDKIIANISPYGVEKDNKFSGYEDVVLSSDGKVLGVNISPAALTITELDLDGNVLATRNTAFTALATAFQFYTTLSFVRYTGIKFTDSLEFNLRLGDASIIMKESTPTQPLEKSFISSNVLGTSAIRAAIVYGNYLIVAGDTGRVGSFDGLSWRNWDGSGLGTGPSNNGAAVGNNNITSMILYQGSIIIGAAAGRLASYDGSVWNAYNKAGTGLWNNGTVVLTDNITALCVWNNFLVVGGSAGKLGSWNGSAWTNYNSASTTYPCDNATLIGTSSINTIIVYPYTTDDESGICLVVAGAAGRVGNMKYILNTFTAGTISTFTATVSSISYQNGVLVVRDDNGGGRVAYSLDNGISFTAGTVSTFTGIVGFISYQNGVLVVRDNTSGRYAYSLDNGISFTAGVVSTFTGAVSLLSYQNEVLLVSDTNGGGRIAYSLDDGLTFTAGVVSTFTGTVGFISYQNGILVVRDSAGGARYAYSIDNGITFTAGTVSTFTGRAELVSYQNGVLVVYDSAGGGRVAYSLDNGITFTAGVVSTFTGRTTFLSYQNGVLVVGEGVGGGVGRVAYSLDNGITFTAGTIATFTGLVGFLSYENDVLVVRDSAGRYAYSIDNGITFTAGVIPTFIGSIQLLSYENGVLVVKEDGTSGGRYAYSIDNGITFTTGVVSTFTGGIIFISYQNGVLVVRDSAGGARYAYSLDDGITFTASTVSTFTGAVFFLSNENGVLVVSDNGSGNRYAYSLDNGISFTAGTVSTFTGTVQLLSYQNGVLLVRDTNGGGRIAYSKFETFVKHIYTSTANVNIPRNNATVIGANNITSALSYRGYLVVGGVGGRIGSFYNKAWSNYNSMGLADAGANMGSSDINALYVFDDKIVSGGAAGRVASLSTPDTLLTTTTPTAVAVPTFTGRPTFINYSGGIYTIADAGGGARYAYSVDGRVWTASTVSTFTGTAQLLSYQNGVLLVRDSAGSGRYAYSLDNGISFTASTIATFTSLINFNSYQNGVLVIRDLTGGRYAYSLDDGITFTPGVVPTFTGAVSPISYQNGVLVVGDNGLYAYSLDDGISFTPGTIATFTGTTQFLSYQNGVLVVRDGTGLYAYSLDNGITFSAAILVPTFTNDVIYVSYQNGVLLVTEVTSIANGRIAYSLDNGISFTAGTVSTFTGRTELISYQNGVLVVRDNGGGGRIAYSLDDGITFTAGTVSTFTGPVQFISYQNGVLVVADGTTGGRIAYSIDNGITWTAGTVSTFTADVNLIASNNGIILVADGTTGGRYAYSLDNGLTWTASTISTFTGEINYMSFNNDTYLLSDAATRVAYFATPEIIRYPYNGSTGIRANANAIGSDIIYAFTTYNSRLFIAGGTSKITTLNSNNTWAAFWTEGGTSRSNLLEGFSSFNYLYTWRYDNGRYLINIVGNTNNLSFDINNTDKTFISVRARYVFPQTFNNKTRHIVTADPVYDAAKIESIGLHGYNDFITYSSTISYPTAAFAGITAVNSKNVGWAGVDHTFNISAAIYNWTPQYKPTVGGLYQVTQSNTNTLINGYCKLTNNYQVASSKPFEIRMNWINGFQSYLSVARIGGPFDNLGVILTNVGEFDDTYTPHILGDDTILYKYNNAFIIKKISTNITNRLQRISENVYKINTISPYNIIDTATSSMAIGSSDYNGRMIFNNTTASSVVAAQVNTNFKRKYSNSIDPGNKLIFIDSPTNANFEAFGYSIIDAGQLADKFILDTYINNNYSYSTFADGSEFVDTLKTDTLYIQDIVLPVRIAAEYEAGTAKTLFNTLILEPKFDGYKIGNEIEGRYTLFDLFGQQYAFDNKNIYILNVENDIFISLVKVCDAYGMSYVASSPTSIFFYSNFDNSLYVFDGGRSVNKVKRLNNKSAFVKGVYSTKDNTLLLETQDSLLWMRDQIWSENAKKSIQTSLKLYNTTDGIVLNNNNYSWRYNYEPDMYTSITPLIWQSAYLGANKNEKSIHSEYVYTIYSEEKKPLVILGKIHTIDESDNYKIQNMRWDINSWDYSKEGYCKLRAKPEIYRPLATSLELQFKDKVVLYEVIVEYADSSNGTISANKTR